MSDKKEKKINDFKNVVSAILSSLGRVSSDRELRRVFREAEGENINLVLEKVS